MTKIKVTQEHINKGQRSKECECPIALAIRERTRWIPRVFNHLVKFKVYPLTTHLPKEAAMFVTRFDCKERVQPFEFEMQLPKDAEQ